MPLYKIDNLKATQLKAAQFKTERELQKLFDANLETLLAVRQISSEFTTGDRQRGRIDTLGIDQNGSPTIIEYKKLAKENVINQGLYYLDWLVDHKGDFIVAAQQKFGMDMKIDWSNPHLILIAEEFTDYDKYAVNRIGANIELWIYRLYTDGILYLEPIFVPTPVKKKPEAVVKKELQALEEEAKVEPQYDLEWHLAGKSEAIRDLMDSLRENIFSLGEASDITENVTKVYIGYRHGKNFCEAAPLQNQIKLWLDISPDELEDPRGLGRDVRRIGHHGTGLVEIKLTDSKDLGYVIDLIRQAYQLTV